MRPARRQTPREVPDLELRGACICCGGNLSIRLGPVSARSVCRRCGAWSTPHVDYGDDGVQLDQGVGAAA